VRRAVLLSFGLLLALVPAPVAANVCRVANIDFLPAEQPTAPGMRFGVQVVAWIEDASGTYVDTVYITQATGTYGIGNRPGRFDLNSAPLWPYGRRITVFPVWAHRHGMSWPEIAFQDANDDNVSHAFNQSSPEVHFCRPMLHSDNDLPFWDAATCASPAVFTDKGTMDAVKTSQYPPRNDIVRAASDAPSVAMMEMLNPFDAISSATPASGAPAQTTWSGPPLPAGNYTLFVEVSREFDTNATYNETVYPSPDNLPYGNYGLPYRGQPSVIYELPFTFADVDTTANVLDYAGYGDPEGKDGTIRPPDATITSTTPGSGAGRFAITAGNYRVRIQTHPEVDDIAPVAPADLAVTDAGTSTATLSFVSPGDDGATGKRVKGYEVRLRVGDTITDANFADSQLVTSNVAITDAGQPTSIALEGLLPETTYSVGVRAIDDCANPGPIAVVELTTAGRKNGEVGWCFIATAAYGSVMANDVDMLRRFRDMFLHRTALGELAVEGYYTFGPAVAQAVGESDLLRETARHFLAPVVGAVKGLKY
jgi:fibronectin type III domain protein